MRMDVRLGTAVYLAPSRYQHDAHRDLALNPRGSLWVHIDERVLTDHKVKSYLRSYWGDCADHGVV